MQWHNFNYYKATAYLTNTKSTNDAFTLGPSPNAVRSEYEKF
jgi:hypothetical protein